MAKSLLSAVLRHLGLRNSNWNLRNEDKRQIPRSSSRILIIQDGVPLSYFRELSPPISDERSVGMFLWKKQTQVASVLFVRSRHSSQVARRALPYSNTVYQHPV